MTAFDKASFRRVQIRLDNHNSPSITRIRLSDDTTPGLWRVLRKGKPGYFIAEYRLGDVRPHVADRIRQIVRQSVSRWLTFPLTYCTNVVWSQHIQPGAHSDRH